MNVLIFGATGMVGQGVLRECLLDPRVTRVVTIGRRVTGSEHAKLRELAAPDLFDLSSLEQDFADIDACFFSLGTSAAGMSEAAYARVTYDLTVRAAERIVRQSPAATFVYVSGAGTDSTERGRIMWARVKGKTENALLRLPFRAAFMFRPALIVPMHGITSSTRWYRVLYAILMPVLPLIRRFAPDYVTTTEQVGRAMITAAVSGAPKRILETSDINAL